MTFMASLLNDGHLVQKLSGGANVRGHENSFTVILYGCEIECFAVREEYKLHVSEDKFDTTWARI
jgi:hypothetical protein